MRGSIFDTPGRTPISSEMADAAMRGSRRASELSRCGPAGWYGRADREISSLDRGREVSQTGLLLFRDSCFPPTTHLARARPVSAADAAGKPEEEEESRGGAVRALAKICVPPASGYRNLRPVADRRQAMRRWPEVRVAKGDESHLPEARWHAIHPSHDEARRRLF